MPVSKEIILNEIKRIAYENDNKPPGRIRFRKLTGISDYDWEGRYWTKWSEALLECGFTPNTMQKPYSETELLEKYCILTNELNHVPSKNEIKYKSTNDSDFPSVNTFSKYGNKYNLLIKVKEFINSNEKYRKLENIINMELNKLDKKTKDNFIKDDHKNIEEGYVYLMKSGRYYKIGKTNDISRRHHEIKIQLPEKAELIHQILTDDTTGIERYWHERFKEKRMNGEWFELTNAEIKIFKRRKHM